MWVFRNCDECDSGDCELCSPTLTLKVGRRGRVVLCDDSGKVVAFGYEEVMRALWSRYIPLPEWIDVEW